MAAPSLELLWVGTRGGLRRLTRLPTSSVLIRNKGGSGFKTASACFTVDASDWRLRLRFLRRHFY